MRSPQGLVALACLFVLSQLALAGPDWNEGGGDAGSTLGSQRRVSSASSNGSTNSVRGATTLGLVGGDQVDLIEINITSPATFKFLPTFSPAWDARIFLFRTDGEPLIMCDNTSASTTLPSFDNTTGVITSRLSAFGEAFTAGRYLIAICGSPLQPYALASSGSPQTSFTIPASGLGLRKNASPTWGWGSGSAPAGGTWSFSTVGVKLIVADTCADAEYLFGAVTRPVSTSLASTLVETGACGTVGRDVWYRLAIPCAGQVEITMCNMVNFDSVLEVYKGDCSANTVVACNNNASGCGTTSTVVFTNPGCNTGGEYLVRVGCSGSSAGGTGNIKFICSAAATGGDPSPCGVDINGDGVVDGTDLALVLSSWSSSD